MQCAEAQVAGHRGVAGRRGCRAQRRRWPQNEMVSSYRKRFGGHRKSRPVATERQAQVRFKGARASAGQVKSQSCPKRRSGRRKGG